MPVKNNRNEVSINKPMLNDMHKHGMYPCYVLNEVGAHQRAAAIPKHALLAGYQPWQQAYGGCALCRGAGTPPVRVPTPLPHDGAHSQDTRCEKDHQRSRPARSVCRSRTRHTHVGLQQVCCRVQSLTSFLLKSCGLFFRRKKMEEEKTVSLFFFFVFELHETKKGSSRQNIFIATRRGKENGR